MSRFFVIFWSLFSVALAVFCGIKLWQTYELYALAAYAAMVVALPVSSFLHEMGHVLFGATVKIKAKPSFSLFGSSSCKIIPETDKNLRRRVLFTAIGGLFVNFILMVVGTLPLYSSAPEWLYVFLPASTYLFWINFTADIYRNGKTDGYIVWELLTNSDSAKVMVAVLTVQAQVLGGKPIEEVEESLLFDVPQIQEDDINFIALTELRYEYFTAKGDTANSEKYKARLESLQQYL